MTNIVTVQCRNIALTRSGPGCYGSGWARHCQPFVILPLLFALAACGGEGSSAPPIVQLPSPAPTPAPAPTPTPTPGPAYVLDADIRYGDGPTTGGSIPLMLDIYQASQNCAAPRPTVMFVHGGGFTSGSRKGANVEAIATELAPLGINVISIQYRLEGNAPVISSEFSAFESDYQNLVLGQNPELIRAFVAAVEDSVRALRWMQANANQHCINVSQIGLWGSSAGAITVLHAAYSLDAYAIPRPEPRVVVDYWGSLIRDGDLEAGETPLFVLHGTADPIVAYTEATQLTNRARQVGVPFTLYSTIDGGHGFDGSGFFQRTVDGQSIAKRTAAFVDAHLRSGGTPVYETRAIP